MVIAKLVSARWVLGWSLAALALGLMPSSVRAESSPPESEPKAAESEPKAAESEPKAAESEPKAAESEPVAVIFTGFARRSDKGASVFVRMTGEVPVALERNGKRLTYRLDGAKLGVANNANPLPTEHFGPPVSHIALVPVPEGVDLVIELSAESASVPPHRLVSQGGLSTLHVDLPPPN